MDVIPDLAPQLVHYAFDAKCTLMSNGPPGDVEILMPAGEDEHTADKEAIRLRLHRGKHTLEVSRHLTKAGGRKDVGEWTKKVIALDHTLGLSEDDSRGLDTLERLAIARLGGFLSLCEVAEAAEVSGVGTPVDKLGANGRERLEKTLRHMEAQSKEADPDVRPARSSRTELGATSSVGSCVVVPPRPRKFSSTAMLR